MPPGFWIKPIQTAVMFSPADWTPGPGSQRLQTRLSLSGLIINATNSNRPPDWPTATGSGAAGFCCCSAGCPCCGGVKKYLAGRGPSVVV